MGGGLREVQAATRLAAVPDPVTAGPHGLFMAVEQPDDPGAVVAEKHACHGPCRSLAQFQYRDAIQRTRHRLSCPPVASRFARSVKKRPIVDAWELECQDGTLARCGQPLRPCRKMSRVAKTHQRGEQDVVWIAVRCPSTGNRRSDQRFLLRQDIGATGGRGHQGGTARGRRGTTCGSISGGPAAPRKERPVPGAEPEQIRGHPGPDPA